MKTLFNKILWKRDYIGIHFLGKMLLHKALMVSFEVGGIHFMNKYHFIHNGWDVYNMVNDAVFGDFT